MKSLGGLQVGGACEGGSGAHSVACSHCFCWESCSRPQMGTLRFLEGRGLPPPPILSLPQERSLDPSPFSMNYALSPCGEGEGCA